MSICILGKGKGKDGTMGRWDGRTVGDILLQCPTTLYPTVLLPFAVTVGLTVIITVGIIYAYDYDYDERRQRERLKGLKKG